MLDGDSVAAVVEILDSLSESDQLNIKSGPGPGPGPDQFWSGPRNILPLLHYYCFC